MPDVEISEQELDKAEAAQHRRALNPFMSIEDDEEDDDDSGSDGQFEDAGLPLTRARRGSSADGEVTVGDLEAEAEGVGKLPAGTELVGKETPVDELIAQEKEERSNEGDYGEGAAKPVGTETAARAPGASPSPLIPAALALSTPDVILLPPPPPERHALSSLWPFGRKSRDCSPGDGYESGDNRSHSPPSTTRRERREQFAERSRQRRLLSSAATESDEVDGGVALSAAGVAWHADTEGSQDEIKVDNGDDSSDDEVFGGPARVTKERRPSTTRASRRTSLDDEEEVDGAERSGGGGTITERRNEGRESRE